MKYFSTEQKKKKKKKKIGEKIFQKDFLNGCVLCFHDVFYRKLKTINAII